MNIYKVSYIVTNIQHPGVIISTKQKPVIGDIVKIGRQKFEVIEVNEISPPEEHFCHLLAKCKYIEEIRP